MSEVYSCVHEIPIGMDCFKCEQESAARNPPQSQAEAMADRRMTSERLDSLEGIALETDDPCLIECVADYWRACRCELTKLKSDVEGLRGTVKEVHDRMHYLLEPDEDGIVDMEQVRQCVDDYLGMLACALEETK